MGFLDTIDKLSNLDHNVEENSEELSEREKEQKELAELFTESKSLGDITIDMEHRLFKVKNATSELKKKSGGFMKATKATAAVMTGGLSLAAEAAVKVALKPDDQIFKFDELRSYEILMDDESITKGGLGMAAAGGLLFGAAGGIAGSVMGKKKTKKVVEQLTLKINLNDLEFPCVMINYINKNVKVNSNAYKDAISKIEKTKSIVDLIIEQEEKDMANANAPAPEKNSNEVDPYEALKKLKELLDLGIVTEEEFNKKKAELLG